MSARRRRPIAHRLERLALVLGLAGALAGCDGGHQDGALAQGDPLHADPAAFPVGEIVLPPLPAALEGVEEEPAVAPPPFSPGIFPCSRCHEGPEPLVDEAPHLPHETHLENGLDCSDCHFLGGDEPTVPSPDMCFLCHGEPDDEEEPARDYLASIADDGGGYVFPRRWQTEDVNAHHAGHEAAGVGCRECHGEPSDAPFTKPRSLTLMQTCIDCHVSRGVPADCTTCHSVHVEPMHKDIVLKHSPGMTGCFQCHHPEDRDTLRLANGDSIPFERSYELCGQCHGPKLRDWRDGLHGKRLGSWDGARQYLLCVHCHRNPHEPAFPDMELFPPPMRPEDIR
jgi:hypothetical protein